LLNATVGVQRVIARLRPDTGRRSAAAITLQRRSLSIAHSLRAGSMSRPRSSSERLVPLTAVALVALAVALSNVGSATGGPIGNTSGGGSEPRLALGGIVAGDARDGAADRFPGDGVVAEGNVSLDSASLGTDGAGLAPDDRVQIDGPFGADGTLLKPVSVDTVVDDGSELIRTYRVKSGDTLTGIAAKFHVSMMTVWWANDLRNKDDLKIGQTLTIPPVNGLVITVRTSDTLESLAARYHADPAEIMEVNALDDPNLVVGQTLTIPGARSAPIPTPKPTAKPRAHTGGSSSSGSTRPPSQYTGGKFLWPVAGGYISQYFHYGHYAIDIAADTGTRVMAAAGGVVTFAGWKNNGGGYQVWIAHGSGLYTTYNHMSAVSVGRGQHVSRGQQVGRVGMTGNATGPHLHFEVWRGPIWDGGVRVNPLLYL
jgi:murein DD-endopeptidase MepM/ murein hydrolase activator NlpD